MNDCLHVLERSPDAAPTDKRFAAWIRIQRLVEECAIAFSLDDPGYTASLGDSNVQDMLKGFERRLANLMKSIRATPGVLDGECIAECSRHSLTIAARAPRNQLSHQQCIYSRDCFTSRARL